MYSCLTTLWTLFKARWEVLRREPEAGYATETVLVTALLVMAALGIVALVISKVATKAAGIDLG